MLFPYVNNQDVDWFVAQVVRLQRMKKKTWRIRSDHDKVKKIIIKNNLKSKEI